MATNLHGYVIEAVRESLSLVKGYLGLAVISPSNPDLIVGARLGSPMVLGLGQNENFLASDPGALVGNTERVVYLKDNQMCVLTPDDWHILDREQGRVEASVHQIDWDVGDGDKGEFEHHMLKEIYEQPEALLNAMRGRLVDDDPSAHFDRLNLDTQQFR